MEKRRRCPLSGIACDDCGYYEWFSTCFLKDLTDALEHIGEEEP
jgi:hypothetical protein